MLFDGRWDGLSFQLSCHVGEEGAPSKATSANQRQRVVRAVFLSLDSFSQLPTQSNGEIKAGEEVPVRSASFQERRMRVYGMIQVKHCKMQVVTWVWVFHLQPLSWLGCLGFWLRTDDRGRHRSVLVQRRGTWVALSWNRSAPFEAAQASSWAKPLANILVPNRLKTPRWPEASCCGMRAHITLAFA